MRKLQSSQRRLVSPIYLESMAGPDQAARDELMLTAAGMQILRLVTCVKPA
jgi:hypothetical protein